MKCKHIYHEDSVNEEGNEVCLYCGKERPADEKALKEMFKPWRGKIIYGK